MTVASRSRDELAQFKNTIYAFAERWLNEYVADLPRRLPDGGKEFNDPVWGTVLTRQHEVAIIDSPLFQRLQDVKQLGVSHLVYRSANHTRFEHSLGSLHAMSVLIREINETGVDGSAATEGPTPVTDELETALRLAALLHDVGHGFMSHVSENAFRPSRWASSIEAAAGEEIEDLYEGKKPADLASYYIILSPAFRQLMDILSPRYRLGPSDVLIQRVGRAVLGLPIDRARPFLSELVSGPFDVDKLDYISRDALMCGVPRVIDTARLIRKLRTTIADPRQLPTEIADRLSAGETALVVTGVARSGARTLDEFALARSLLTDKVYRHQKTRAYEALVASICSIMAEHSDSPNALMWEFTDSEFLTLPADYFAERSAITSTTPAVRRKLRLVEALRKMLRERSDYIGAYTWSVGSGSVLQSDAEQSAAINLLREAVRASSSRQAIERQIAETVIRIYDLIGDPLPVVEAKADLRYLIRIDPVDEQSRVRGRALLTRAFLIGKQGAIVRFTDDFPDIEGASDQYLVNREASAVFAPRALASAVHLAAERVVYRHFGLDTTGQMRDDSHVDLSEVDQFRQRLGAAGFYDGAMRSLGPTPPSLMRQGTTNRIVQMVERFVGYQGPASEPRGGAANVTDAAVREFLRQVPDPDLVIPVLRALEHTKLVTRQDFEAAVLGGFQALNLDVNASVVAVLGDPDESSSAVTYLAREAVSSLGVPFARVDQLSSLPGKTTCVLIDDFIGLGTRSSGVISAWLGQGADAQPLPQRSQDALRSMRVACLFAAGMDGAEERLGSALDSLGLTNDVYVHDHALPRLSTLQLPGGVAERDRLIAQLTEVGEQVLLANGTNRRTAVDRALGYGNHGFLVVFPYSTPKQTVTAFWASGPFRDGHWRALFPR